MVGKTPTDIDPRTCAGTSEAAATAEDASAQPTSSTKVVGLTDASTKTTNRGRHRDPGGSTGAHTSSADNCATETVGSGSPRSGTDIGAT
jgi:hypothetical protein